MNVAAERFLHLPKIVRPIREAGFLADLDICFQLAQATSIRRTRLNAFPNFVLGTSAATERDAVTYLVLEPVRRGDLNASPQPEWSATLLFRVLDQADRYRQRIFNGLPRGFVPGRETSRRAIVHLADEQLLGVGMIRPRDLAPNLAVRIAETRECAKAFRVGELKDRADQHLRLIEIGFMASRLGSFKSDLKVCAVTERLG